MPTDWWNCPGPQADLARITRWLREGRSVIYAAPRNVPRGMVEALRGLLGDSPLRSPCEVEGSFNGAVGDSLFDSLGLDAPVGAIRDGLLLAQHESLKGELVIIKSLQADHWGSWKHFLRDYFHASRNRAPNETSVLLVLADSFRPLPEDVGGDVETLAWSGPSSRIDMLFHAHEACHSRKLSPLRRDLTAQTAASVAAWDPTVCELLAACPLDQLLEPKGTLLQFAEEMDWTAETPVAWEHGTECEVNGQPQTHPAMLAVRGEDKQLSRRVWMAQVRVLMPHIELMRAQLLPKVQPFLRLPFTTKMGDVITDPADLEVNHIAHQLSNSRAPSSLSRQVRQLATLRNKLAHLRAIPAGELSLNLLEQSFV